MPERWEIEITKDGIWPTRWRWEVWRKTGSNYDLRMGQTFTRERAHRKAAKAKVSMQRDDVRLVESS